ncbi:HlyD family efflux transporter periplasmic adaptor subunit [Bradyrhizobium liaoningense]|uniref:HlyD family efflux transporter periplasmic adaptor subunit n=1 Tax=Bradyrhizobium liaoningense TaxID=43992 RepID=UPI001BA7C7A4|nr:HlyD family efflux transporter periplasmic adaptor subunit [Bradyrhizobium liaoningense]MBR0706227.1 HlyD family efflux transporter periplasmic adaptor subunit [Bradyrhizobium liaoningense]
MNKQFKAERETTPALKVLHPDAWALPRTKAKRSTARGLMALAIAFGLAVAAAIVWFAIAAQNQTPRTNLVQSPVPGKPAAVVGLGYLEPSTTVVRLGAPGNPDASRISLLLVSEGQSVKAGEPLAIMDTADKLWAQVTAAQVQVELKELMLERQRREIAYTIQSRRSALDRARADINQDQSEYDRQKTLVDRSYATVSNLEKKARDLQTAQATKAETEAALERIEAKVPGTDKSIDVAIAEQEVLSAQADLAVAKTALDQAIVRAPFDGRVLSLKARVGERVGNDGLLELGATDDMRVVVDVYQSDIGRVRLGQAVDVRAEAISGSLKGRVTYVGDAVVRQTVINNDPATSTDARVVQVYVSLSKQDSERVEKLSRLQVRGVFAQ